MRLPLPASDTTTTGWANGLQFAVVQGLHWEPQVQIKAWGFWGQLCSPRTSQALVAEAEQRTGCFCLFPLLAHVIPTPCHRLTSPLLEGHTSMTSHCEISRHIS